MQCRIVHEGVMHASYYLDSNNIPGPDPEKALELYCQLSSVQASSRSKEDREVVYKEDMLRMTDQWADMFTVLQAANVLQMPLYSVYPEFPQTVTRRNARDLWNAYNIYIPPQVPTTFAPAAIMWIGTSHRPTGTVNDFVAIVR